MYKNTAVSMIAMLSHLEVDIEILDVGIETAKSDDCRGVSKNNRDANDMLATMQERVRFSYKYG